jgi:hypothetical protein
MEQQSMLAVHSDFGSWEELYYASLLELDSDAVGECNGAAEVAIRSRFLELSAAPGHQAEREAMCDALQSLMELRALDGRKRPSDSWAQDSRWLTSPRWVV